MITTVIFDLDDTLYDEAEYCRSGFRAVSTLIAASSKTADSGRIFDTLWTQFSSGNRTKTFDSVLEQFKIPRSEQLIAELVKTYREHAPQISLPDDSRDTIRHLKEGRYKLALLTDGFLPAQQLKVKALGIEKDFDCIVYTEQLGRQFWKPSPAGFEKIMKDLAVQSAETVYVADNLEKDFVAPNRLGMMTVQMLRPARLHNIPAKGPDYTAQYVIRKISQLPDLFG